MSIPALFCFPGLPRTWVVWQGRPQYSVILYLVDEIVTQQGDRRYGGYTRKGGQIAMVSREIGFHLSHSHIPNLTQTFLFPSQFCLAMLPCPILAESIPFHS